MDKLNCLILFLKEPAIGRVKTRLGSQIGMEKAMNIYKEFLKNLSEKVFHKSWNTIIYYSADGAPEFLKKTFGKNSDYRLQKGGDLGEKMHNAFSTCLSQGAGKVCILGGDSPDLPPELVTRAFAGLNNHDVVLGPTTDGGYYLLGMNHLYPDLFKNISWSTPLVYRQTLGVVKALGLKHFNLPPWNDIDNLEDFKLFVTKNPGFSISSSKDGS